ncbi:MAG: hypothetical protein HOP12_11660 [Candidatus Eisenbacteria bacterium]|uniref:Uncharacterized protein n=1 Tax=Eiseniibacteriota bacterium TaxID=2212470 RepID=A0A849SHF2_UNCEI|nr:hypothetical protein [Candidatus Eisenbacteria bacterium]
MHFLDAWTELSFLDLGRLLAPIAMIVAATFLPGARTVRFTALGVALLLPLLGELALPLGWTLAWSALWIAIAWWGSGKGEGEPRAITRARGALESGTVGLGLGLALIAFLGAAVVRQDLSPEDARRTSWGLLVLGTGYLNLMLRRHLRRAALAFGAMGLGLQVLHGAARGVQLPDELPPAGALWLATAVAAGPALRLGWLRERTTGSAWVNDAHDLHD